MSAGADVLKATSNGIEVAYEALGDPSDAPIMLIHGLATQMVGWPDEFCDLLAERGLYVIRFDNRDVGQSTHLRDKPAVDLSALMAGEFRSAPYLLADMALDTIGLMDALGLGSAHLVGASMGGAIAQTAAFEHPARVRSLTSIMSTTGDRTVGQPTPVGLSALLTPQANDREGAISRSVHVYGLIGSPGFPFDEAAIRDRAGRSYDRGHDPAGVLRQLAAVFASGDRTENLRRVTAPTLVIHGRDDPLATVGGGIATAECVPNAELVLFDGMGHDLPRALWPQLLDRIAGVARRGDAAP